MSDQPINLNKARKARGRIKKRSQANENAVKFGRTKLEKAQDQADVSSLKAKLDAHKRET